MVDMGAVSMGPGLGVLVDVVALSLALLGQLEMKLLRAGALMSPLEICWHVGLWVGNGG